MIENFVARFFRLITIKKHGAENNKDSAHKQGTNSMCRIVFIVDKSTEIYQESP